MFTFTEKPLVVVLVLNYNGRDHLPYCLPSLLATDYPNFQIIVVDNASSDGSAELAKKLAPNIHLIQSSFNLGWSGGNNIGIKAALEMQAKYIVLANSDIKVDPRWLSGSVMVAESDQRVGVVGFNVLEPMFGSSDYDAGFTEACQNWQQLETSAIDYAGGMAMFVRASLFEQIGLIDEGFWAYAEEIDFQLRVRKADYTITATNLPVWHYGGGSFNKIPLRAAVLQNRNNLRLLIKHSSVFGIIKAGTRHLVRRCLPFITTKPETETGVERRLRGRGPLMAFGLMFYAVGWNLMHLPATIKKRREDNGRAANAKRRADWV